MNYEEPNTVPTEDDMNAMYEQYECRSFDVICLHCGLKATATQSALNKAGWYLGREGEVCLRCMPFATGINIGRAQMLVEQIEKEDLRLGVAVERDVNRSIPVPF